MSAVAAVVDLSGREVLRSAVRFCLQAETMIVVAISQAAIRVWTFIKWIYRVT